MPSKLALAAIVLSLPLPSVARPFQVLADGAGAWEATWRGTDWATTPSDGGGWSVRLPGEVPSYHEGDLDAPRLGALLAIPAGSAWALEIVEDSGRILASRTWARVPHADPSTGRTVPASATQPPSWTERTMGGVRLVSLDVPLVQLQPDGSLRVRTKLRVRATWTGSVRPTDGTGWKNIVDNPGGIGLRGSSAAGFRDFGGGTGDILLGKVVAVQVGDTSVSGTLEDGVVRLTGAQLYQVTGAMPGSASWNNVALYASSADTVSEANPGAVPGPNLRILPIHRSDRNGDGVLDPDDEIWFWARGTSIWKPDIGLPGGWRFSIHPYSRTRRYFVRLDAPTASPELGAPRSPSARTAWADVPQPVWAGEPRHLLEVINPQEGTLTSSSGNGWFWQDLRQANSLSASSFTWPSTSNLPGIAKDSAFATIYLSTSGLSKGSVGALEMLSGSRGGTQVSRDAHSATYSLRGLSTTGNQYSLANSEGFLVSGYSVTYRRDVSGLDSVAFPAPGTGAISVPVGASANCWVLEHGEAVRNCALSGRELRDSVTDPDTWYAVFGAAPASRQVVLSLVSGPVQGHAVKDLSQSRSLDMVVVASDELLDVAEEYAAWREDSKQIRPMKVGVVRLQDIWDRWSGGAMDPAGLRNALRWFWSRWGISHALLLGGGHADPRGLGHSLNGLLIPVWEDGATSTDDFFTWFDSSGLHAPRIALGRVPARSVSDARSWLEKVKIFENPVGENLGPWRNTALLVADDQWQGAKPDPMGHANSIEVLGASLDSVRPWIRDIRLYESTYPKTGTNTKPDATRALVDQLNQGVAGFSYMGHGASTILSDELLLDAPTFQRSVSNSTRPFFFFAGSCTVGLHDDPDVRSLSELIIVSEGRGGHSSIAATRPSYSDRNEVLVVRIWARLLTGTPPRTVGEALQSAKLSLAGSFYQSNAELYNLLGDPALVLFPGTMSMSLDSMPSTLAALSKLTISGSTAVPGEVRLDLRQTLPKDTFILNAQGYSETEIVTPTPRFLLSNTISVGGGRFSTPFLLPARLPQGDSARLSAYVWDSTTRRDGGVVSGYRKMSGVGSEIPNDRQGPSVRIRSCDSTWSAGVSYGKVAKIPLPFCLQVDMQDSSGISTLTQGPDEGVTFALSGVRDPWHPDVHQGADYRSAYAQLALDTWDDSSTESHANTFRVMPGGTYEFQASARDLMGNFTRTTVQLQPQATGRYALFDVFTSPNPVRDATPVGFYFKISSDPGENGKVDSLVESSIRIHSISGKLLKVLRTELSLATDGRPRASWDLRDSHGRTVANGIYPYAVTLRIPSGSGVTRDVVRRGVIAVAR